MGSVRIERVDAQALPVVMRIERQPGYERLVGRWSEAQHLAALADKGNAYLIGHDEQGPRGFAIVCTLDDPHGNVVIKRIAAKSSLLYVIGSSPLSIRFKRNGSALVPIR